MTIIPCLDYVKAALSLLVVVESHRNVAGWKIDMRLERNCSSQSACGWYEKENLFLFRRPH